LKNNHSRKPENLASRIARLGRISETDKSAGLESGQAQALMAFGVKIGALRRKLKLGLDELAAQAGLDPDLVLSIELGAAPPEQVRSSLPALGAALGDKEYELSALFLKMMLPA